MTLEEIGAYIKLLCFQAAKGSLPEESILKKVPRPIWEAICCKFEKDANGYYNKRLRNEIVRRRLYTQSRRKNLHMDNHMDEHMEGICQSHMETETETENKDVTKNKRSLIFIKPTIEDISNYCKERHNNIDPQAFIDFYASKGWMIGKNKMKDWRAAVRTWEVRDKANKPVVLPRPPQKPSIDPDWKKDKIYDPKLKDIIHNIAKERKV